MVCFNLFKDGKPKAVTMSYDDGNVADRRLVEIFNRFGIHGTFHLNSALNGENTIPHDEYKSLYKNHEISAHGMFHHTLSQLTPQGVVEEILGDRRALETISGGLVRGMSYANGAYSEEIISYLKACGIVYARTTESTGGFKVPANFLKWNPTCHHHDAPKCADSFLKKSYGKGHLLYIWGHSFEFDHEDNWDMIESVCMMLSGHNDIWYATNIEICDYITATRTIQVSVDNNIIVNPTAIDVWFSNGDEPMCVKAGQTLYL